ncbi:acyltransferase family protein [Sphingomonas sp. R86520]|uniref:acyltransferase family protein n=1 Tax=Sphingomonas sp. R86520 TaxID=3093859 RepID=UPI0036D305C9
MQAESGRLAEKDKLVFVDWLRGLAILLVIVVHHSQRFPDLPSVRTIASYGQLGVQLFFVASAFTLCLSADARRQESHATRNFYLRRLIRIAPLYYFGIFFYLAMYMVREGIPQNGYPGLYTPVNIIANLLFVHSFVPGAFNGVVPGGWSIGTEMTFYAIFPFLHGWFAAAYDRYGIRALVASPAVGIAVAAALECGLYRYAGKGISNNNLVYCNILNQLPVFLIGMSAYFVIRDGAPPLRPMRDLAALLILGTSSFLLLHLGEEGRLPAAAFTLLPATAALSFVFVLNLARSGTIVTRSLWLARVGQLSYSMYIFHFAFAWVLTSSILRLFELSVRAQAVLYLPTLLLSVLASLAVAKLSKRQIEDRFIDKGKRLIRYLDSRVPPGGTRS